jgi:hypothetical protein
VISFVTCSLDDRLLERLRGNLARTAGVEHELVVHRNREAAWGLARAYNSAAAGARFPLLCFLHEDVEFLSAPGWAGRVVRAYAERPDAGVAGFAGCRVKSRAPSGWLGPHHHVRQHFLQGSRDGSTEWMVNHPAGEAVAPVAVIDGMCLFVRRADWAATPFDDRTFPGFHGYDLDFCTAVGRRRTNLVFLDVDFRHDSPGTFDRTWRQAMRAYHLKWKEVLPLSCAPLGAGELAAVESYAAYRYLRGLLDDPAATPEELAEARAVWRPHRSAARSARLAWRTLRRRLRGNPAG